MILALPKHQKLGQGFTRVQRFEGDHLHPGRRTDGRQTAATWITELGDRRKVILLCSWCAPKFNPRRHRYRRMWVPDASGQTSGYVSNGMCDDCKQRTALSPGGGTAYISEESYAQVCQDPADARRRARQTARANHGSTWGRVQAFAARAWGSRGPRDATTRSLR